MLVNFLRANVAIKNFAMLTICLFFRGATTRLDLSRKRWFTNMRDYSRFYWPVINLPPGNYQGNASPLRVGIPISVYSFRVRGSFLNPLKSIIKARNSLEI